MRREFIRSVAIVAACLAGLTGRAWGQQPPVAPTGERFGIGDTLTEKVDSDVDFEDEGGAGDKKEFPIPTDDDISATKVGDIYSSGEKTAFKVASVEAMGSKGGTVVFQRSAGASDPTERFARVQGLGAISIKKRIRLIDFYWMAGWPAHLIAALAVAAILMAANSIWLYRRRRQCPPQFVAEGRALLDQGNIAGLEDLALQKIGLFPHLCRALCDRFDFSTEEDIRFRMEMVAGVQINRLRVPTKALNFIAVCAPLLGLAGTIYGMMIVFEGVAGASGAGKAAVLAAGIRVKLLCTLFALMVAIPSLLLFFVFNSRLGTIISEAETLAEEFLHKILILKRRQIAAAEDASPPPVRRRKPKEPR